MRLLLCLRSILSALIGGSDNGSSGINAGGVSGVRLGLRFVVMVLPALVVVTRIAKRAVVFLPAYFFLLSFRLNVLL